jgi:maltose O-acetyltransferase
MYLARNRVTIGRCVSLGPNIQCKVDPGGRLEIGDHCEVRAGVLLDVWGQLSIGARTFIGHTSTIGAQKMVEIGNDCLIAECVTIRDQDHRIADLSRPIREQGYSVAPVRIGNDVWLGAKVTVCKGVSIGDGCVVGANAVVTRDLPPYSVAVGAPARVVRYRTDRRDNADTGKRSHRTMNLC